MGETALDGCRVLDLTDDKGALCGKILGDLGADVIKVEPPQGDSARYIGPFYNNIIDPEFSLYWFSLNTNKRGITLDIETEEGCKLLESLVKGAGIVIESFDAGYMDKLGLGYGSLKKIKPDIIVTSISAYGQDGPYSTYKTCDLVAQAMSGFMYMIGDPDRPPVRISMPQAYLHAGGQAAAATSIAYYYWQTTGEGQSVDVPIHGSMMGTVLNAVPFWDLGHQLIQRSGPFRQGLSASSQQRELWRCKDGFVAFIVIAGVMGLRTNENTVKWMAEENMAPAHLVNMDWGTFDQAKATSESVAQIEEPIQNFFLTHTMSELYDGARERGIMLTPIATPREIIECPHLEARGFWQKVEHPKWGETFLFPGPPAKLSATPSVLRRRAPMLGEHNVEIYVDELGISQARLTSLREARIV
ncbi:CaiB/BaiF CoA transferase family protein [Chloroflexota bacterium]